MSETYVQRTVAISGAHCHFNNMKTALSKSVAEQSRHTMWLGCVLHDSYTVLLPHEGVSCGPVHGTVSRLNNI